MALSRPSQRPLPAYNRPLHQFAIFTGGATLALIFIGGLVTSTGSGLAVPDWPTTYGRFMFAFPLADMVGGILYEHGHRMVASLVGLLVVVLALWLWRSEQRPWVRSLGWVALGAVVLQGTLGGVTVLLLLPTPVSVLHATLAQTFFLMVIALAYATSREFVTPDDSALLPAGMPVLRRWITLTTAVIFLQLILGAVMRHTGSGLAFLDFPLTGGRLVPSLAAPAIAALNEQRAALQMSSVTVGQLAIHVAHRLGALAVTLTLVVTAVKTWRLGGLPRGLNAMAWTLLVLLGAQIALGAATVLSLKQPFVTTAHVATGAALLGLSFLFTLRVYRYCPPWPARETPPALAPIAANLQGRAV